MYDTNYAIKLQKKKIKNKAAGLAKNTYDVASSDMPLCLHGEPNSQD